MLIFMTIVSDDEVQFRKIYDKYYQYALRICLARIKDYHMAEDILSISFYKIHKHLDRSLPEKAIKAFIIKVVNNDINNYLKSISKKPIQSEFAEEYIANEEEWKNTPLDNLVISEGINNIYNEISNLSPKISETMLLLVDCNLSKQAIAEILEVPVKTVYSRITLGRKQLKEKLSKRTEDNK